MFTKSFFEHYNKSTVNETPITRIDSPKVTQEQKSRDFDTSSIRSPLAGRKNKKSGSVYADEVSAQMAMNRYQIENANFAKGAYGKVTLAVDKISKESVVIKQVPKTTPIRMIQNEVRAGQILGYHPNIATFHKYLEFPEHHTMIFSFVDGMDLFTYLENVNFSPRPDSEVRSIVLPILHALQYSQSKGVSHRDVKLENILLDSKGKASLIDYGLCAFVEEGKKCREWCGSDNYLAPEIVRRIAYDPNVADVFSMGIVLFALLFGVFPFENLRVNSRFSNDPSKPLPRLHVRFPSDVKVSRYGKDLLLGMLEDDPEKRLTISEVLEHEWVVGGQQLVLPKLSSDK